MINKSHYLNISYELNVQFVLKLEGSFPTLKAMTSNLMVQAERDIRNVSALAFKQSQFLPWTDLNAVN